MAEDPMPSAEAEPDEVRQLREEVLSLRARLRTYPLISQAEGILQERYALRNAESAFALMQRASQQFNVKLRTVAGAVVTVPRPEDRQTLWFPRRARQPEPALSFVGAEQVRGANRGAVLGAVLSTTLAVVGTDMGNLQTADRVRGGLRIEKHHGHTPEFLDFFDHVGEDGTSCALAAQKAEQVTIRDVETAPVFTEPARQAILHSGSRACHSVPLTTASGACVGVVSAHAEQPVKDLRPEQLRALDIVGTEAGQWLAWYDRTVVLDALEYLHGLGRRHKGRRVPRS